MDSIEVPVLIVGAGPAGATTALLLGQFEVRTLVISRHRGTANTPRAHIFNQRAMEVLRDAGLEEIVRPETTDARNMMHTSWLHSLAGQEYGRIWAWGNRPDRKGDYEAASPCSMSDLPQNRLEPILVEQAMKLGAEFRFSTEFVSQSMADDGKIKTQVKDRSSNRHYTVRSQYLIGADGARSSVLDSLGIPVIGKQLNTAFNVHIKADVAKFMEHRPGTLNWILNPDAPHWSAVGNFRMVRPWYEFVVSMHPAEKDGKAFEPNEDDIKERLYQMIGVEKGDIPITLLSSFRWTINDQVAETWQEGKVICIGDAVHRHPPINGLGSNTCISDAFNLAWKLAYVLKGIAEPSILDSVTIERKPVGDAVVRRANDGMEDHRKLWDLIGLSADERQISTNLMAEASPKGKQLREAFQNALAKTDDEVNALGMQMNQIYLKSPLTLVENDDRDEPNLQDYNLIKEIVLSTFPGFHLPHIWLAKNGQSPRISILDLCGRGKFTLITGIGGSVWREWTNHLMLQRPGLAVTAVTIGWGQDYMDAYGDWAKIRGVDEEGAVLVRPDHFVAWRCKSLPVDGNDKLEEVFKFILPIAS